jgi:arginyl-tRNA synthetase
LKDYRSLTQQALNKLGIQVEAVFEEPKNLDNGDVSTNVALKNAKLLKKNPRQISQEIIDKLNEFNLNDFNVESVEIAGPGFINFKLLDSHFHDKLKAILSEKEDFGKNDSGKGKKVNVEYVSANPTGPLHMGHGRNAAMGDSIANLYTWNGYDVTKEYYFNNAGNQMNNLGKSVYARYVQLTGDKEYPFPEDGYHGEYIWDIAKKLQSDNGDNFLDKIFPLDSIPNETLKDFREAGEKYNFEMILATLDKMAVKQDVFFNEDTLYKEGKIDAVVSELRDKGLAYDKDGAVWLRLSEMGQDDDRVIIKNTGEPTYRLPDIAYHIEKFKRGFDVIIDVFGSDHIATIPDVMSAVNEFGYDTEKIKVVIHQFVTLTENGQQVKMSKRSGKSYTLDDIIEEVGSEVTRFFLLMRSGGTHLEFDIDLAKEQSDKNPVFYLQYAHARVSSIIRQMNQQEIELDTNDITSLQLELLKHNTEINLIRELDKFPYVIETSAMKAEPHIVADYLRDVAGKFHAFYHDCRILGQEKSLATARLSLALATKTVIKNGLNILGISAPEKM